MPAFNPALDLIRDLSDPGSSGCLVLDGTRVVKATSAPKRRIIRNSNGATRIRICRPAAPGSNRAYNDVDPATENATIRMAFGTPDGVPDSGTVPLAVGAALTSGTLATGKRWLIALYVAGDNFTNLGASSNATGVIFTSSGGAPTNWTHSSQLQEITTDFAVTADAATVAAALNATRAITNAGGVTVVKTASCTYEVTFVAYGAQTLIAGPLTGGMVPASVVSVSRVQAGVASSPGPGVHEVQLIRLLALPYCFATIATAFPAAAYAVDRIRDATSDLPAVKRLTLDPPPLDGSFVVTLDSKKPFAVPFDCSVDQMAALAGPSYCVEKRAGNIWDIAGIDPAQDVSIGVDVSALIVPKGVTGTIALNTVNILRQFASTAAQIIRFLHQIDITFAGQAPQPVLFEEVEFHRSLIDLNSIAPPTTVDAQFVASNLIGNFTYSSTIVALTGGTSTCLDFVDLTNLAVGTCYKFRVAGVSQEWFVASGDANPADPTGEVHWINYNSGSGATNKHWERGE